MARYALKYTLTEPCKDTEDMYFADLPAMPGCHAWGKTPEDAEENLPSMALAFLESYEAHGDELPAAVIAWKSSAPVGIYLHRQITS